MARHIYDYKGKKGMTTLHILKSAFQEARRAGFDVKKAKRYATYHAERSAQGNGGRGIATWTDYPSPHASVYTYDRLVKGDKTKQRGFRVPLMEAWERMKKQFPRKAVWIERALVNIRRLLGERAPNEAYARRQMIRYHSNGDPYAWAGVRNGRQLFIEGLGGFDIAKAYEFWAINSGYGDYVVPHPWELTLAGYLCKWSTAARVATGIAPELYSEVPSMTETESRAWQLLFSEHREWFIRYWPWLSQNLGRIDELPLTSYQRFDESLAPDQLIRAAEEADRQQGRLTARELREQGNWIPGDDDDWGLYSGAPKEYTSKLAPVQTSLGEIRPVKNTAELYMIGKVLKNCTQANRSGPRYNASIREGSHEMVVLFQEGKPLALCEVKWNETAQSVAYRRRDMERYTGEQFIEAHGMRLPVNSIEPTPYENPEIIQLKGPMNRDVPAAVWNAFKAYLGVKEKRRPAPFEELGAAAARRVDELAMQQLMQMPPVQAVEPRALIATNGA